MHRPALLLLLLLYLAVVPVAQAHGPPSVTCTTSCSHDRPQCPHQCRRRRCGFSRTGVTERGYRCVARRTDSRNDGWKPKPHPPPVYSPAPATCPSLCHYSILTAHHDCASSHTFLHACEIRSCVSDGYTKVNGAGKEAHTGWACVHRFATPSPTPAATPPPPSSVAYYSTDAPNILACNASAVFVAVNTTLVYTVGQFVLNVPATLPEFCQECRFLARQVTAVTIAETFGGTACPQSTFGCVLLSTTLATPADLAAPSVLADLNLTAAAATPLESVLDCDAVSTVRAVVRASERHTRGRQGNNLPAVAARQFSVPRSAADFLAVNSDGRCLYTDCFVGTDGPGARCFDCGQGCSNGCTNVPDSVPFVFDFESSCDTHDYCYLSTFRQAQCDAAFLRDMLVSCAPGIVRSLILRLFLPSSALSLLRCPIAALLYYTGVSTFGGPFYASAQERRIAHQETAQCVAKCPTTQESGGQGTTTLKIDMLRSSGSFPVMYNMFTIPDGLTISYEGTTIFTTGGLVSGSRTVTVSYGGNSSIITAVLEAPRSGTEWDLFIGCPSP